MSPIERITIGKQLVAMIIYSRFSKNGIEFFTPGNFSQQLGYMKRDKGYIIHEHRHILRMRKIKFTQETLFIRKGRVKINFYSNSNTFFASRKLGKGDVVLLASGGHGLEFLEKSEVIEVKQGPYLNDRDKVRFEGKKR